MVGNTLHYAMISEQNTNDIDHDPTLPTWVRVCVLLLMFVAHFAGTWLPLLGPDEPRYSQVAKEMFERGDWVTPTLGGFNWFEKPALLYWLQNISYHLFGVNEFSARFGSVIFGLAIAAFLSVLIKRTLGGTTLATAAWMMSGSALGLLAFAHGASFDIVVTFPITASLVCFWLAESKGRGGTRMYATSFAFMGLGLLAKGLIGIVFPLAVIAGYFVLAWRRPTAEFLRSVLWGIPLALAVASAWYLPMYLRHGWAFIDEFIIQHHFQRFTSNKYQHPQPFIFFFWVLPLMTLPWLPLCLSGLYSTLKRFVRSISSEVPEEDRPLPFELFLLVWIAVPLLFFSFSGSKLPGYILPSVPPAVLLGVLGLKRAASKRAWLFKFIPSLAAGIFVIAIVMSITVMRGIAAADSVKGLIEAVDARGYSNARVVGLHTVSHNAEFYASGRLVRDLDGRQRRFLGTAEIFEYIDLNDHRPVIVLVPVEYERELIDTDKFTFQKIAENGDLIAAVASPVSFGGSAP